MSVRAKFKCLHLSKSWDDCHTVSLAPIYKDDGAPENADYFKYTPSGNAEIQMGSECMFKPNGAYYIDMVMLEPDVKWEQELYRLKEVIDKGDSIEVKLSSGWGGGVPGIRHGEIEMTIDNEAAWPHFKGQVNSIWQVTFTEAPK